MLLVVFSVFIYICDLYLLTFYDFQHWYLHFKQSYKAPKRIQDVNKSYFNINKHFKLILENKNQFPNVRLKWFLYKGGITGKF